MPLKEKPISLYEPQYIVKIGSSGDAKKLYLAAKEFCKDASVDFHTAKRRISIGTSLSFNDKNEALKIFNKYKEFGCRTELEVHLPKDDSIQEPSVIETPLESQQESPLHVELQQQTNVPSFIKRLYKAKETIKVLGISGIIFLSAVVLVVILNKSHKEKDYVSPKAYAPFSLPFKNEDYEMKRKIEQMVEEKLRQERIQRALGVDPWDRMYQNRAERELERKIEEKLNERERRKAMGWPEHMW